MGKNPLIDAIDSTSPTDDLMKIDNMIKTYETQGILDRKDAIKTIKELIRKDKYIGQEHSHEMILTVNNWVVWEKITTPCLVDELKKLRYILTLELGC